MRSKQTTSGQLRNAYEHLHCAGYRVSAAAAAAAYCSWTAAIRIGTELLGLSHIAL